MRMSFTSFTLLAVVPLFVYSQDSLNDDVLALTVFKAGVEEDPHRNLASWNVDNDSACKWNGVTCDPENRVIGLVLDGFSLSGKIGRGILRLQSLRILSLSKNNFSGDLPTHIGSLGNLTHIDLSYNNLSGCIPLSLVFCWNLEYVNFSSNKLTGALPEQLWHLTRLKTLDLSNNLVEGTIPDSIKRLQNLTVVNLQDNKFSGTLPDGIGRCLLLESLELSGNTFSGSLPNSLQNLKLCGYLSLRSNSFGGEIPSYLGEMQGLRTLDLSSNQFTGAIPEQLLKLGFLTELNLSRNGLRGEIPESLAGCKRLHTLDFSHNFLTGDLPGSITISISANRSTGGVDTRTQSAAPFPSSIQILDLSDNSLSGVIPSDIGQLSNLKLLNLSVNSLLSEIPKSIGNLGDLEVLDLSNNRLNGSIPSEIGEAVALRELRLEGNSLSGRIPPEIERCSSLTCIMISHNHLTGSIPGTMANLTKLERVDLSLNNLTGSIPRGLADLSHLVVFNISQNHLQGNLPASPFFNTIVSSSISGNPSLCGAILNRSCPGSLPKPIVLDPGMPLNPRSGAAPAASSRHKKVIFSISALVAIGAAVVIAMGVVLVSLLNLRVRNSATRAAGDSAASGAGDDDNYSGSPAGDSNSGKLVMFSGEPEFSTGTHALLNKDCELGRGGFGAVYRTFLCDGRAVAIKKLTVSSLVKSQEEFEREVRKLGKISHRNMVHLEGYYWTTSLQLLIYEFVAGGSLYKHLHESSDSSPHLSWSDRFNIIAGVARGLYCLHRANLIHYNLKSSNVLLDEARQPKVGDYGLAKLLPMLDRYILSSKIQSALGYMAPEFACRTVKITHKCDVYAFGVLALEIATGRRPVEYMEDDVVVLCDMVREALEEGRVEECVDGKLAGDYSPEEAVPVMKLALVCTSQVPSARPDMDEVLRILEVFRVKNRESPDC